ncbi:hypothetical protein [Streptococcus sp. SK140]|uniref:hypothetical protein n=1 Tax=Streptococcus sp. SK140 TaxID=1095726 RepID=UPI00025B1EB0|nr:hypothetical protein [Streptococcus sp. SK140]EIF40089.1 hypothetical protein HMPREF1116_1600 [Streptococcus sp. SK140]
MQAALTSINQLQATPKEEEKPEQPANQKSLRLTMIRHGKLAEAIQNKTKDR